MKFCPNCNAELSERPCAECGWPETTRPPPPTFWQRFFRARPTEQDEQMARGSSCCSWVMAVAGSLGFYGFWSVGERAHWTSDGPGMLLIYAGVFVCGVAALMGWAGIVGGGIVRRLPPWMRFWFFSG